MIMQVTDCTCGMSARRTRSPLSRVSLWKTFMSMRPASRATRRGSAPAPACGHLDLVAQPHRRAEVDLDPGDDDAHVVEGRRRAEMPQEFDPRRLDVGQEDGVVDVPHRVE